MKNNKGFTLIELLVVIAIIGVLSQIIIVSVGEARAKARDAQRIAELRNFASALELFRSKYDVYPCGDSGNGIGGMIDSSHSYPFLDGGTKPGGPPAECSSPPIYGLYGEGIINSNWHQAPDNENYPYFYETTANRQSYVLYTRLEHPGNAAKMANDNGQCSNLYEVTFGTMPAPVGAIYLGTTCN